MDFRQLKAEAGEDARADNIGDDDRERGEEADGSEWSAIGARLLRCKQIRTRVHDKEAETFNAQHPTSNAESVNVEPLDAAVRPFFIVSLSELWDRTSLPPQ